VYIKIHLSVSKLSLLPLNTRIAKEPTNSVVVAKYSRMSVVQGELKIHNLNHITVQRKAFQPSSMPTMETALSTAHHLGQN